MYNKEYAYYSVNYFEFPLNDSLFKTVGPTLTIKFDFEMYYARGPLEVNQIFMKFTDA